ncbi:hypothetical protein Y420_14615, partial [Listeria monocytogenes]
IIYILNDYKNKNIKDWLEAIQVSLLTIPIIMMFIVGLFNLIDANINLKGWGELSAIIWGIGIFFSFLLILIRYFRVKFLE